MNTKLNRSAEMKLAAFVDDGLHSEAFYRDYIRKIMDETGADGVAALMAGAITQSGFLPAEDAASRAQKLRRAGCSLVVEVPVHGCILKHDTYYYVLAMLILKMNCVDWLYLPCRPGDRARVTDCARFMLAPTRAYQAALARRPAGCSVHDAVPEALELFVPGAQAVLEQPMNRFAAEMMNALKLSYCPTAAVLGEAGLACPDAPMPADADARLGAQMAARIAGMDVPALGDIFGSTNALAERMQAAGSRSFTALSQALGSDAHEGRQLLLRTWLNYRFISHSNSALYSYVPNIRALAGDGEWLSHLQSQAAAPVLSANETLSDLEALARNLYTAVHGGNAQ